MVQQYITPPLKIMFSKNRDIQGYLEYNAK